MDGRYRLTDDETGDMVVDISEQEAAALDAFDVSELFPPGLSLVRRR